MTRHPTPDTLHAVAQMLGAGGWSEHCSHTIKRWWKRHRQDSARQYRIERNMRVFSETVATKLDDRDRMVLGRAIGIIARMHFDAGLTMGMLANVQAGRVEDKQ